MKPIKKIRMPAPYVSVCVITYNHGVFIRACLEGILQQQTNFSFEVVIGDDCSTDGTRLVIEEYRRRYPHLIKTVYPDHNVGGARNAYEYCFPRLEGQFVAICEGDDYWTDPLKLQKQVDFLEHQPEYAFCFHRVQSINDKDEVTSTQEVSAIITSYNQSAIFHISIPTLSVVFRKYFSTVPAEMLAVKSCDAFLFGLLARHGKAADLGFMAGRYRKHEGGVYNHQKRIDQFRQSIATRKKMQQCNAFSQVEKKEIKKEILRRKLFYSKYFLLKSEILNSMLIMLT